MPSRPESKVALSAATLAAAMIAHQVGGKATRDALFLSTFDFTSLPYMFIGASLFSLAMVVLFSRLLSRIGPARLLPTTFVVSALLFFGEWALLRPSPKLASLLLYLHMTGLGGVLISAFWSVVNERFNPRTAKQHIGRIASGATFGGLLGGLMAERVAATLSIGAMLPFLGLLHIFCAWRVLGVNPLGAQVSPAARRETGPGSRDQRLSAWRMLREVPYLRNLAILVLLTAVSNISLDYVFKAYAAETYGSGATLLRFFAIFYTIIALATLAAQTILSRRALETLGLARTVGSLPLVVAVGSAGAAAFPGMTTAAMAQGLGSITNDSLFRSGYEILYTPIPPQEKRATKPLIDVGCERVGDLVGAGIIRLILQAAPAVSIPLVLGVAIVLSIFGLWFTRWLNQGYILSLEHGLQNRAVELDLSDAQDSTTRSAILRTIPTRRPPVISPAVSESVASSPRIAQPYAAAPALSDPVASAVAALRSGDAQTVRQVLREHPVLDIALASHVISLLAWDEIAPQAVSTLRATAPRIAGQLVDTLLDPDQPFAVQRRIPRVLSACATQRVADGLLAGLANRRFEVRFQCGQALYAVIETNLEVHIAAEAIFAAVLREAAAGRKVWEGRRLLDIPDDQEASSFVDDVLRDRTSRSMQHVFRLLSLALPKKPLQIAFRGLYAGDENLRGIALEYLESILPVPVREALWPYLEDRRPQHTGERSHEEILATLMRSHQSIELDLAALRAKSGSK